MNKKMKWGLIAVIVIGLAGLAIHAFVPRENKELSEAPSKAASPARSRTLNVIAETIKQSSIFVLICSSPLFEEKRCFAFLS